MQIVKNKLNSKVCEFCINGSVFFISSSHHIYLLDTSVCFHFVLVYIGYISVTGIRACTIQSHVLIDTAAVGVLVILGNICGVMYQDILVGNHQTEERSVNTAGECILFRSSLVRVCRLLVNTHLLPTTTTASFHSPLPTNQHRLSTPTIQPTNQPTSCHSSLPASQPTRHPSLSTSTNLK